MSATLEGKLTSEASAFESFLKPKVASYLKAAGLDKVYEKAEGDYLYYLDNHHYIDNHKVEYKVTDFLGGYGVSLFGHNHPELTKVAIDALVSKKPFASQASVRSQAGRLAERLSELLEKNTGIVYMATLANSGAEVVEAAIKHAVFEKQLEIKAIFERQAETFKKLRLKKYKTQYNLANLFEQVAVALDIPEVKNLKHLDYLLQKHNEMIFAEQVCFLAVEGSFHGKSTGAIKLTSNQDFRAPWVDFGIDVKFIERNEAIAVEQLTADSLRSYIAIEFDKFSEPRIVIHSWSLIAGCFAEVIQGEGGIHELDASFLQALAEASQDYGYPLIIDEIQSGMGRTGDFLASSASGVIADYYLFSKALGGGIAKTAALLVKKERYIKEFGYLHSSTFAEDDFSSVIALKALDLLEANNAQLMQDCRSKGEYLKQRLEELVRDYPKVFKEVRGRGLMLGLEILPQVHSKSKFLKMTSEQSLLGYLICGYLLNVHAIRIAPTLSAELSLRIEPSAYISLNELDRLVTSFKDVAVQLENHNSHVFVAYLINASDVTSFQQKKKLAEQLVEVESPRPANITSSVACIAHFMEPLDLVQWDPYLKPLSEEACEIILEKTQSLLEPFLYHKQYITSASGEVVELNLVGVPYTAEQIISRVRGGEAKDVLELMKSAYEYAKELGVSQVGFTGYSSIATNNCTAITEDSAGLTSGNSLTAALALDALHSAMEDNDIEAESSTLAVVGGAGNIGKILAEIEAEQFAKLILIGRQGSERRLKKLASRICEQAYDSLLTDGSVRGIAKTLEEHCLLNNLYFESGKDAAEYFLNSDLEIVKVSTDMGELKGARAIITATNTPDDLIYPEHLAHGSGEPTVISDVSVPADVSKEVLNLENVSVLNGGRVLLPLEQSLNVVGMPLQEGELYACMAETILLGFEGIKESFSYGALEKEKVKKIRRLSHQHGFKVRKQVLNNKRK